MAAERPPQGGAPPAASHMRVPQALPYVALLIVMLFFIYAVIGMQVGQAPGPQPASPDAPLQGSEVTRSDTPPPTPMVPCGCTAKRPSLPVAPSLGSTLYREKLPQVTQ